MPDRLAAAVVVENFALAGSATQIVAAPLPRVMGVAGWARLIRRDEN